MQVFIIHNSWETNNKNIIEMEPKYFVIMKSTKNLQQNAITIMNDAKITISFLIFIISFELRLLQK